MSLKLLTIIIDFPKGITPEDIRIRHILSDTIENRNIGKIIDEGSGSNFMDISIEMEESKNTKGKIISILESLGLLSQSEFKWESISPS